MDPWGIHFPLATLLDRATRRTGFLVLGVLSDCNLMNDKEIAYFLCLIARLVAVKEPSRSSWTKGISEFGMFVENVAQSFPSMLATTKSIGFSQLFLLELSTKLQPLGISRKWRCFGWAHSGA